MSEFIIKKDGVLYHHGIKGQKWGNRRWQNEDGSLTAAGREHYGYGQARSSMVSAKAKYKADKKAYGKAYDRAFGAGQYIRGLTKKGRAENDKRYAEVVRTAKNAEKSRQAYKSAKAEYKDSDEYKVRQEKIKKAAKIGLAVAGTALAVYGGYKIAKLAKENIKYKKSVEAGKAYYKRFNDLAAEKFKSVNNKAGDYYSRSSHLFVDSWGESNKEKASAYAEAARLYRKKAEELEPQIKESLANWQKADYVYRRHKNKK